MSRFRVILLLIVFVVAASLNSAQAAAAAALPLEKVPTAEEVLAFASEPPLPTPEQNPPLPPTLQMSREDLLRFLGEGVRVGGKEKGAQGEAAATATAGAVAGTTGNVAALCEGVFFTRKGAAYFWTLADDRHLYLKSSEGRSCVLELKPESAGVKTTPVPRGRDEFRALTLPAAGDVQAFANALPPATGFQLRRTKEEITRFLRRGKPLLYSSYFELWQIREPARITVPGEVADAYRKAGTPLEGRKVSALQSDLHIEGALVGKEGKVYFWRQWGDDLLQLSDTTGAECMLKAPRGD